VSLARRFTFPAAQAIEESLTLLSDDLLFQRYGVAARW